MELNKECILLQSELKKFGQQVILPRVEELDRTNTAARDHVQRLGEMGLLGAVIPEALGGTALDTIGLVVSLEELSKVCGSTALITAVHNVLFAFSILESGNEMLKNKYLPGAASGKPVGGWAETATSEVQVKKDGANYLLNGKNPLILNGVFNGPFIISLKNPDQARTVFIVEPDAPGMKITPQQGLIGMKAAGIAAVAFENSAVPVQNLLASDAGADSIAGRSHDLARLCLAAIGLGIAQAAMEAAVKYAKERAQFGSPIIKFGMVREKIVDMAARIEALRLFVHNTALDRDREKDYQSKAAMARYLSCQAAIEITTQAIQVFGGYGYMKDYPVERYFRDAQVVNVIGSTPQQDKERIARTIAQD